MLRIPVDDDAYLIAVPPPGADPHALEAAVRAAGAARPAVLAWDALVGSSRLRFGEGGLDDLLAAQIDLSPCCAVLDSVHRRLKDGQGAPSAASLAQLARDPRLTVARLDGFAAPLDPDRAAAGARKIRPAAHPDLISAVVLAHGSAEGVEDFIHALATQKLASRMEVVVVAAGLAREDARALSDTLDSLTLARPMRIRHFILPGRMGEAVAVNTGLALATGQAVIVARPDCRPDSAHAIQTLANWAAGGDVFSVSPRIVDGEHRLISAGLYAEPAGPERMVLKPWTDRALSGLVRRVAAPAPWFFAVNRSAWLDHGGAAGEGLWTASLARAGKHLLAGSAAVVWTGQRRPPAIQKRAVAAAALSPESARAMAWSGHAEPVRRASPEAPVAAMSPSPPAPRAPEAAGAAAVAYGFSDPFPSSAPLRLLVFADGFGASQSLAFIDGLARTRGQGQAAVRIIEERALPRDGAPDDGALSALVERHFAEVAPSIVVLSRFGHEAAVRAVIAAARERRLPILVHLDDDLFDLPPIIGVERYRLARHPRRQQALHRSLAEADLAIAATPALAEKLARLAGHGRIGWMEIGSAGRPHPRGPARTADQSLVIGYMGSASHNHDLEMIAPALNAVLERFDHVSVELFGSIAQQPAAEALRGRLRKHRPVSGDYQGFKSVLASMGWDIGLAPLRPIAYNRFKTPTKWIEYAEAGIAVVVSDSEVYQPMIRAEAALASGPQQWESAMARLIEQPQLRADLVTAADRLLRSSYGWERLEAGMLGLLRRLDGVVLAA